MSKNVIEYIDAYGGSATNIWQAKFDGEKLIKNGGAGTKDLVNHVRRAVMRMSGTFVLGSTVGHTVTVMPSLAFGIFTMTTPSAPLPPYSMQLPYLISLYELEHQGRRPDAYLDGVLTPGLWDGVTITTAANPESHTYLLEFPFEWYRPWAAVPDDAIFPVNVIADATFSVAYTGVPAAIRLSGTAGGDTVTANNGTATLSFELIALPHVQIGSWTLWRQDSLPANTLQPTGITKYDALTVASGIVPTNANTQFATTDINQLGYRSDMQRTDNGLVVQTWYDQFNQDAQVSFTPHTFTAPPRTQALPLVFPQRVIGGQTVTQDCENANSAIVMNFDVLANSYVILRRMQLAHGANGENLAKLKQAVGIPSTATGTPILKNPGSTTGLSNGKIKGTVPYRYSPAQIVK